MKRLRLKDRWGSFVDPETGFHVSRGEAKVPQSIGKLTHAWIVGGGLLWVEDEISSEPKSEEILPPVPEVTSEPEPAFEPEQEEEMPAVVIPSDTVLRGFTLAKYRALLESLGETWEEKETRRMLLSRLQGIRDGKY